MVIIIAFKTVYQGSLFLSTNYFYKNQQVQFPFYFIKTQYHVLFFQQKYL